MSEFDVLHKLPIRPFAPTGVWANPHVQTTVVPFLPSAPFLFEEKLKIPIEGGALAARLSKAAGYSRSVVIVVHGITGTGDDGYVRRLSRMANRLGVDALRLAMRGAGDSAKCGVAPIFHAGLTDDIRAAVTTMAGKYQKVHLVGYSLGGQVALRAIGEWGDKAPSQLASVTAISPPVSLAECAAFSERDSARTYTNYIVSRLKDRYYNALPWLGPKFRPDVVRNVRTIRDFDGAVIAPVFGFDDAFDYYQRTHCESVLHNIPVPTLIIHAADDPLVPSAPVSRLRAKHLSNIRLVVPPKGGHVAFYQPNPIGRDTGKFWAEQTAVEFVSALS